MMYRNILAVFVFFITLGVVTSSYAVMSPEELSDYINQSCDKILHPKQCLKKIERTWDENTMVYALPDLEKIIKTIKTEAREEALDSALLTIAAAIKVTLDDFKLHIKPNKISDYTLFSEISTSTSLKIFFGTNAHSVTYSQFKNMSKKIHVGSKVQSYVKKLLRKLYIYNAWGLLPYSEGYLAISIADKTFVMGGHYSDNDRKDLEFFQKSEERCKEKLKNQEIIIYTYF